MRDPHRADDLTAPVFQRYLGSKHPSLAAVRPGFLLFSNLRLTCTNNFLFVRECLRGVLRAEEIRIGFPHCLRRISQSEILGHRPADAHKAAIEVLEKYVVWNMLQEGFE